MLCEPKIGALSRMRAMRAATPKARRRRSKRPSGRGEEARPRICRARKASKRSLFLFFWRQHMSLLHYRRLAALILAAAGVAVCGGPPGPDPQLYFRASGRRPAVDMGGVRGPLDTACNYRSRYIHLSKHHTNTHL